MNNHIRPTMPGHLKAVPAITAPPRPKAYEETHEFKTTAGTCCITVVGDPNVEEADFNQAIEVTIGEYGENAQHTLNSSQVNRLVGSILRAVVMQMFSKGVTPADPENLHPLLAQDGLQQKVHSTLANVAIEAFKTLVGDDGEMAAMFALQWAFVPEASSSVLLPGKPQQMRIAKAIPEIIQLRLVEG